MCIYTCVHINGSRPIQEVMKRTIYGVVINNSIIVDRFLSSDPNGFGSSVEFQWKRRHAIQHPDVNLAIRRPITTSPQQPTMNSVASV